MRIKQNYFKIICLLFVLAICNQNVLAQTCFNAGNGADGAYHATSNTTIVGGVYNFTTFTINAGVVVTVTGSQPLMIHCTGQVLIDGTLTASGGNGQNGVTYSNHGIGGIGVAGGHNGGDGIFTVAGGPFDGFDGYGQGGTNTKGSQWSGGGGAGYASVGQGSGGASGGFGGLAYGNMYVSDLLPGSGGGGGSGGNNCGSGGGGAGGGVIVIHSAISIVVNGSILCNGGNGGTDGGGSCGGGGGGSGGVIWLASPLLTHNGLLSAVAGQGGGSNTSGSPYFGAGGIGALGRIRLDYNGSLSGSGSMLPLPGFQATIPTQQLTVAIAAQICYGDATGFIAADCSGGIFPYTYEWAPVSSTDSLVTGVSAGTYYLTVTDVNWCSNAVSVILTEDPQIDVSTSVNIITISANQVGASYQWLDCDLGFSIISGETNQSFTPVQNGNYAVEVTVGQCSDISECVTINSVGMDDYSNTLIQVYPNPSDGYFAIYLPEDAEVTVFDLSGKEILTKEVLKGINNIDLREMCAGVYIMKIAGSMSVKTEKLIIQH